MFKLLKRTGSVGGAGSRAARRVVKIGVWAAAAVCLAAPVAMAQQAPVIRMKENVVLDDKGDGKFRAEIKLPAALYTNVKANSPNTAVLMRRLGLGHDGWSEVQDIKGSFEDGTSTVVLQWTTKGLGRVGKDRLWELPVADGDMELVSSHDNVAVLTATAPADWGVITMTTRVELPAGSKDAKLLRSPPRLAFRMPAAPAGGSNPSADFALDVKPQLMTCLAKSYGNPKFPTLWVARSVFTNNGDQTLKDYRVRFRLVDYTSTWGPWQRCDEVVPGQTVVDAYFPVFDLDKAAKLNGARQAALEVQYQYKRADGKPVEETETKNLQLLGRNQVYYSSLKKEDMTDFYDAFNLGSVILASFVTHDDPVIQQVAGWVSGQADGAASALDDKEAVRFLAALYDFLAANKIAYQTPPGPNFDGQFGQHVKYGRDVLRNRAGTCIDLAIFYASVCDAVGLKPVMFLVPGHCFPAVYLPSGQLVAVETTMVGKANFQQAYQKGMEEAGSALSRKTPAILVDVKQLHDQGVHSLELPDVPADVLDKWGIKRVEYRGDTPPRSTTDGGRDRTPDDGGARRLLGTWTTSWEADKVRSRQAIAFNADGTFLSLVETDKGQSTKVSGTYTYANGTITLKYNGVVEQGTITWVNDNQLVYGYNGGKLTYTRVK